MLAFTREDVLMIAKDTSNNGIKRTIEAQRLSVSIYSITERICVGLIGDYHVSVSNDLTMHCTCKAWEMSSIDTCKHGCAMALTWLDHIPVEKSIDEILGSMPVAKMKNMVVKYANNNASFEKYIREYE